MLVQCVDQGCFHMLLLHYESHKPLKFLHADPNFHSFLHLQICAGRMKEILLMITK